MENAITEEKISGKTETLQYRLEKLEKSVAITASELQRLEERLKPLLKNEPDSENKDVTKENLTPLVAQVDNITTASDSNNRYLIDILDRLSL